MEIREKYQRVAELIEGLPEVELDNLIGELEKKRQDNVLGQELSAEELDAVAGGKSSHNEGCYKSSTSYQEEEDKSNCIKSSKRNIYGGAGFANCAATVEDGSHCKTNDACYTLAVDYQGMTDCAKAWR